MAYGSASLRALGLILAMRAAVALPAKCSHLKYFGWWYPGAPGATAETSNFFFQQYSHQNDSQFAESHALGLAGMANVEPDFFTRVLRPNGSTNTATTLRADWAERWANRSVSVYKEQLWTGSIFGFFMGDELISNGLPYADLVRAANAVKASFPDSTVYFNAGRGSINNFPGEPQWQGPVPAAVDWISFDMYPDIWTVGGVHDFYRSFIFPLMNPRQRAVLVPPAYLGGGMNAYGGDDGGLPGFNLTRTIQDCGGEDCDAEMTMWATWLFNWACTDTRFVAMLPYMYDPGYYSSNPRPFAACTGRRSCGAKYMPRTRNVYERIGASIKYHQI